MKFQYLHQDQKEKLNRYLSNILKWNDLKFCISDIRYFFGLKTVLKINDFDVDVDDLNAIQRSLGFEKTFLYALNGDLIISWI